MEKPVLALDEVGRGPLAGPVITGAIILSDTSIFTVETRNNIPTWKYKNIVIRDSKLLSALQRERANEWLLDNAISFGIGKGSVKKINKKGIVEATNFAFRSAISHALKNTAVFPQKLLIDAFFIPNVENFPQEKQEPIVHGDRTSIHIAAASIIAKVYRDSRMKRLGNKQKYLYYDWANNKGYGTKSHIWAIQKYGTTKHHRTLFVRNIV